MNRQDIIEKLDEVTRMVNQLSSPDSKKSSVIPRSGQIWRHKKDPKQYRLLTTSFTTDKVVVVDLIDGHSFWLYDSFADWIDQFNVEYVGQFGGVLGMGKSI